MSCGIHHVYGEWSARLLLGKRYYHSSNTTLRNGPSKENSGPASVAYPARKSRNAQGPHGWILPTRVLVKMMFFLLDHVLYYLSSNFKEGDKENIEHHHRSSFPSLNVLEL